MQHMTTQAGPSHASGPKPIDYSLWSIEELMRLASQLRVSGAREKSRRELIDLFAVSPNSARR